MKEKKSEFVYKSTLKSTYGLTDSWIKKLGAPDKTVPNPYYSSGPPASLYQIKRVEDFIDTHREAWLKLQELRVKRQKVGHAIADKKYQQTIEWAEMIPIETFREWLPKNEKKLERAILDQHTDFLIIRNRDNQPFTMTDNAKIAYLRHNHTNYEALLSELVGRVGTADAYIIIRSRCDELATQILSEFRNRSRTDGTTNNKI